MADQRQYGVTPDGFVIKGIDTILAEQQARARDMFGSDVDLTPGSPIRKILDAVAWQAQDVWRGLERQYYSNFIVTADGQSLDLLGADLGIERRNLRSQGLITFTLGGLQFPGRSYVLPEGTIVQTGGGIRFRTKAPTKLELPALPKTVPAEAMERGPAGDIGPNLITQIDPDYARTHLTIPTGTTVTPSNPAAFAGGALFESDDDYRSRLRGFPRTVWTLDRIAETVRDIDGVRDVRVFDPLGGVDVSQSYFNLFRFSERVFSADRRFASPYFFDIVVATDPGWPWRTGTGAIEGRYERIVRSLRDVRPVSIFPNVVPANQVEIGVRCTLKVQPGHDRDAILGDIRTRIHRYVASLHLGGQVLYSDVLVRTRVATGVLDVQQLHLRRCPPQFDGINFGGAQFRQTVEMAVGENIDLASDEVAFFTIDSQLIDIEVVEQ
jgi:hypothetical protein